jgi:hypothetical protein
MIDGGAVGRRSEALAETMPRGAITAIDQDQVLPGRRSMSPGEDGHRRALSVNSEHRDPARPIAASATLGDGISQTFAGESHRAPDRAAALSGERPIPEPVSLRDDLEWRRRSCDDDSSVLIHQDPDHETALLGERPIPESVSFEDDLQWRRRSCDHDSSTLIHQSPDRESALGRAATDDDIPQDDAVLIMNQAAQSSIARLMMTHCPGG